MITPERLLQIALEWLERSAGDLHLLAAGHRVVHGGERYSAPVHVDAEVMSDLDASFHSPHCISPTILAAIKALGALRPDLPQVACFDTAFHRTQPKLAQMFALPRRYWEEGFKAYGFHGLSYEYIMSVLAEHLGEKADGRIVIAHLGSGASMCAIQRRQSVASTMGFTALKGLMMGTRCGALDPGVILYSWVRRSSTCSRSAICSTTDPGCSGYRE